MARQPSRTSLVMSIIACDALRGPVFPPFCSRQDGFPGHRGAHVGRKSARQVPTDPMGGQRGEPYCPQYGCRNVYTLKYRRAWKCGGCARQFSVTSGSIFADGKRPLRGYLLAIAISANDAKGHGALQLSRDSRASAKPHSSSITSCANCSPRRGGNRQSPGRRGGPGAWWPDTCVRARQGK